MKKYLFIILITPPVLVLIALSLPFIWPTREWPHYTDNELRKLALSKGLKPTPSSFEELKKLMDTPSNPLTPEKIALGKQLFFDANLSKNRDISCATCHSFDKDEANKGALLKTLTSKNDKTTNCAACHLQDQSGTDRFTFSVGEGGRKHPHLLNTQTILNSALAKFYTWSAEVKSIEDEAANSIHLNYKMDLSTSEAEVRLNENNLYREEFKRVFNEDANFKDATKAIAAYVKTLITRGSYDRFLDGDNTAISPEAKRGLADFINFGCKGCHSGMSIGGQSIQRFPLRKFALISYFRPNIETIAHIEYSDDEFPFKNNGGFLGKDNNHLFRVPVLRNVAKTSPYFHNGAVPKLREAVATMAKHQVGLPLTSVQIDEIVAFLKTLNGDIVDYTKKKKD
ncbi:cytochrome c peroxidase [Sulfurimonas sp. HSL-1716]|uniref:cytochrome-c peroxidase n=1 Tax=Hydrocurvibacter sulfurireducens TaxID=3131937 RepID=UPI0031F8BFA9